MASPSIYLAYTEYNNIAIRHAIHLVGLEDLARNRSHNLPHEVLHLNRQIRQHIEDMRGPWLRALHGHSFFVEHSRSK